MTFLFYFLGWIQLINFQGEFVFVSLCRHPRWMTRLNWLAHDTPFNHTSFTVHITQTAALSRRGRARCSPLTLSVNTKLHNASTVFCFCFCSRWTSRAGKHTSTPRGVKPKKVRDVAAKYKSQSKAGERREMCGLTGEESQSWNTTKCHLEARQWRRCKFIQMHKKLQRESLKPSQSLLSLQFICR